MGLVFSVKSSIIESRVSPFFNLSLAIVTYLARVAAMTAIGNEGF